MNQYALDLRLHMEKPYRQVQEHMGLQHQRQKELYNKSSNDDPFKVGDMVWLHCLAVPRGKSHGKGIPTGSRAYGATASTSKGAV